MRADPCSRMGSGQGTAGVGGWHGKRKARKAPVGMRVPSRDSDRCYERTFSPCVACAVRIISPPINTQHIHRPSMNIHLPLFHTASLRNLELRLFRCVCECLLLCGNSDVWMAGIRKFNSSRTKCATHSVICSSHAIGHDARNFRIVRKKMKSITVPFWLRLLFRCRLSMLAHTHTHNTAHRNGSKWVLHRVVVAFVDRVCARERGCSMNGNCKILSFPFHYHRAKIEFDGAYCRQKFLALGRRYFAAVFFLCRPV